MQREGEEESGKILSPKIVESTLHGDTAWFTVQGIADALNAMKAKVTEPPLQQEEFALQLGVTMADRPGWLCPPSYSSNAGMVVHVLKTDPALRELEYVQVEAPGTVYLFFYDKMDTEASCEIPQRWCVHT